MYQIKPQNIFYLILLSIAFLVILLANPFLRYPYDIFAHLITIDEIYQGIPSSTSIQSGRLLWHSIWATVFTILHIDSTELILRAKIIFVSQVFIGFASIYYFSKVLLRNLFKDIAPIHLQYLSLWSSLIWISIFATHSVNHHLVWSLWYGVNYQITLPLFFYIFALSLVLCLETTSIKTKVFFILQIIGFSLLILRIHPMEFLYYLMYLSLFMTIYLDKVYIFFKKYYYMLIPIILILSYNLQYIKLENSKIFSYLHFEKIPLLYDAILSKGHHIVGHLNRESSAMNELMYLLLGLLLLMSIHILYTIINKRTLHIHIRIYIFILIATLFLLIPLYEFSSGLFGILARPDVVHRLYYSSSIFILLPLFGYYLSKIFKLNFSFVHLYIFLILIITAIYSKYNHHSTHNYYKNLQSIKHSMSDNNLDFHLCEKDIITIGKALDNYENTHSIALKYYARTDIAFVIKFIYHKDVYWEGRRANPNYKKQYQIDKAIDKKKILFQTPKDFPHYVPFF